MVTMRALMYFLEVSVILGVRCSVLAAITDVMNITRKVASTSSDISLNVTALIECYELLPSCEESTACGECYEDIETSVDECDLDTISDSVDEITCDLLSAQMCCWEHVLDGGCPADEAYTSWYECFMEASGCSTEGSQCEENSVAARTAGGALLLSLLCSIMVAFTVGIGI